MVDFIDQHRESLGVESICMQLPIAPSTYYRSKQLDRYPELRSERSRRDDELKPEVIRVWEDNHQVYGARKVWKQLNREQVSVARCTVARLMKQLDIQLFINNCQIKSALQLT